MPNDFKLDELVDRVRAEVEKNGGFIIIGLNGPKQDGNDTISAAAVLHGVSRAKVIFTVAKAIQLDPGEVIDSLMRYRESKIGFKSPIQAKDLGKSD